MKKMERTARAGFSLLLVIALLCGLAGSALGATTADLDPATQTGSITVKLEGDGEVMRDGELTLYQVAELTLPDWNMVYELTQDFAGCGLDLSQDAETTQAALEDSGTAVMLAEYVRNNNIAGMKTASIAECEVAGQVVFEDLPLGLYLIVQTESATGFFDIDPFLVSVPWGEDGSGWNYYVDATPKVEVNTNPVKSVETTGDGAYDDDGNLIQVGDTVSYKITYENVTGQVADIVVRDTLSPGLTYVSSNPAAEVSVDSSGITTLTWTFKNTDPGTEGYVVFTATVNEAAFPAGLVENTASVKIGDNPEVYTNPVDNPVPQKGVDTNSDGVYDNDGNQVKVGDTVSYEITVQNVYDSPAAVTITDELDVGLDYVDGSAAYSVTDEQGNQLDNIFGTASYDSGTLTWVLQDVPSGATVSATFSAVVNDEALVLNLVTNSGTVQFDDHPAVDTNPVKNPVPEKGVDTDENGLYDDDGNLVEVGQTLTYEITYWNAYEVPAEVIITDVLDIGLTFISADNGGVYDENTRTITWNLGEVPAGTGGSVTFKADVNEDALVEDLVRNTASVKIGEDSEVETNPVTNYIPGKGVDTDGNLDFGDDGEEVNVGDVVTYRISYKNGHDTAATVTITDVLDPGLTFISADNGGVYDADTRTITWDLGEKDAGYEGSVTFTALVNENALEKNEVDNIAGVQIDLDSAVNTNPVENPVPEEPTEPEKGVDTDNDGVFDDDGEEVQVGQDLTYQITYYNNHAVEATVTITDTLDPGLDFVSASDGGVYDSNTRTITWILENVDALTAGSVSFTATVNESALVPGEVENMASVQIANDSAMDTNIVENPVPEEPEEPTKDVDADGDGRYGDDGMEVQVGDVLTYEITYYNNHVFQRTVTITDKLDENVAFVSASDGGVYDPATHTVTWTISSVPGRTHGSVTLQVEVLESALTPGEVENTASVQVGNNAGQETNRVFNPVPEVPSAADLTIVKNVSGASNLGSGSFDFRITLTAAEGTPYSGTVETVSDSGQTGSLTFVNGEAIVTLAPGEALTLQNIRVGTVWSVEELTDDGTREVGSGTVVHSVSVSVDGEKTSARASIGTIADSTEVVFTNSYREYFGIDEEIVTDEEDIFNKDAWVKDEAVNEYNAIEIEMTTYLPVITVEDLLAGEYTMAFHNVLDSALNLDETDADFSVYIGGVQIGHQYYTIEIGEDTGDGCSFHVTVNLTALYMDGIITEEDLQGNTEITIFFFADLEGTGLNGSYTSTVWYQIYDGDELLYTSNVDVVYVYTYEIEILKVDGDTGDALAGAEFGVYYDETCNNPVIRSGEAYTEVSGEDGMAIFYGLANGTYYVLELSAPTGYVGIEDALEVTLGGGDMDGYALMVTIENTMGGEEIPEPTPTPGTAPEKAVDADGDGDFQDDGAAISVGQELTYEITFFNDNAEAATVTVTDALPAGIDFVSAENGGEYDPATHTVTWVLEDVPAMSEGSVQFTAVVNENALTDGGVNNTAIVQVGDDPAQSTDTNTVSNPIPEGTTEPTPEPGGTPAPGETEEPGSDETPSPGETEEPGADVTPSPGETEEPGGELTPVPGETEEPGEETQNPEETPSSGDEPVTVVPDDTTSGGGTTTGGGTSETLPQTGMIFWPIIILAIAGGALVCAGLVLRKRQNIT